MKLKNILLITVFLPTVGFGASAGLGYVTPPMNIRTATAPLAEFTFGEDPVGVGGVYSMSFDGASRGDDERSVLPTSIAVTLRSKDAVAMFIEEYAVYKSDPIDYVRDRVKDRKIKELRARAELLGSFCFTDEEISKNTSISIKEKASLRALRQAYYAQYGGPHGIGEEIEKLVNQITILSNRE